jgi:hypothetical protein
MTDVYVCPQCNSTSPRHRCPVVPRTPPINAGCPHHAEDAVCTECPGHTATDGYGFPHPTEAKGLRRLQRCKHCGELIEPPHWVNDIRGAWFGCVPCFKRAQQVASEGDATPKP